MNWPTIIVGIIVVLILAASIGYQIHNKKNGRSSCGCGGSCGGCSACSTEAKKDNKDKEEKK